jgi:hypothetical protein
MAVWIVCPVCLLKHSRRADGRCPKCGAFADARFPEPQTVASVPRATALEPPMFLATIRDEDSVSPAARLAGALLIVNAVLSVLERAVLGPEQLGFVGSPIAAIVDVFIGGSLLANKPRFLTWAQIRVGLGAVVFSAIYFFGGHVFLGLYQLTFSLGLFALLPGKAGRLRLGVGTGLVGLCLSLEILGLAAKMTGRNPLARLLQERQLEANQLSVLEGKKFPYHVRCPDGWYLVKPEVARRQNPSIDRWITNPDHDTHLYVIAERLPAGSEANMAAFERAYLGHARAKAKSLEVADPPDLVSPVTKARFLHTRGNIDDLDVESYVGLFAKDEEIAQVVVFAHRARFASHQSEFKEMLSSFTFGTSR